MLQHVHRREAEDRQGDHPGQHEAQARRCVFPSFSSLLFPLLSSPELTPPLTDFDAHHGFAIRGDPNDEKIRKEADRAFDESVAFLKANL
jgi:hypothetical protein